MRKIQQSDFTHIFFSFRRIQYYLVTSGIRKNMQLVSISCGKFFNDVHPSGIKLKIMHSWEELHTEKLLIIVMHNRTFLSVGKTDFRWQPIWQSSFKIWCYQHSILPRLLKTLEMWGISTTQSVGSNTKNIYQTQSCLHKNTRINIQHAHTRIFSCIHLCVCVGILCIHNYQQQHSSAR